MKKLLILLLIILVIGWWFFLREDRARPTLIQEGENITIEKGENVAIMKKIANVDGSYRVFGLTKQSEKSGGFMNYISHFIIITRLNALKKYGRRIIAKIEHYQKLLPIR